MSTLKATNIKNESSASNNIVLDSGGGVAVNNGVTLGTGTTVSSPASNTFTVSTNGSERIRVDSSGRFAIGVTSPAAPLDLSGDVIVRGTNSTVRFKDSGNTTQYLAIYGNSTDANINAGVNNLVFYSAGTERARFDGSGRLLVGTPSSVANDCYIQSYRSTGSNRIIVDSDSLSNSEVCDFLARGAQRQFGAGVYKHSGITNEATYISPQKEDGGAVYLWVGNDGNWRISTSDSHIGTNNGTVVGTQTSDERLKNILGPIEYGLETIKQIEPVRYSLKINPECEKLGFIAQQVHPLVPESIFDTKENIEGEPEGAPTKLGMEYTSLIPVLVNAIKELSAEVDNLKAQLS